MSVHSAVGLTVTEDLTNYEVRTISKGQTADNKAFVSSKTGGKTCREPGNIDKTWDISLYAPDNVIEIPSALEAGKTISVKINGEAKAYKMIIDSSAMEVDIEGGEIVGISLGCSAVDATDSY